MPGTSSPRERRRPLRRTVHPLDAGPVAQLVMPIDHHQLSRLQPLGDHGIRARHRPGRHRLDTHRAIGIDPVHIAPHLAHLDRRRRHHHRLRNRAQIEPHIDELVGKQLVARIVEPRLETQRPRAGVDLVVHRQQRALGQPLGVVAAPCLRPETRMGPPRLLQPLHVRLRQGKQHMNGLRLRERHQPVRVRRRHHVARIHLPQPGPAGRRCHHARVRQVHARRRHRSLIESHRALVLPHQRRLRIHLLRGNRIERLQLAVAPQIIARIGQQGLVALQLPLGLHERSLLRPRIDHRQHLPLAHPVPLMEQHLLQRPRDLRTHHRTVAGRHRAQRRELLGRIATHHGRHAHRHGPAAAAPLAPGRGRRRSFGSRGSSPVHPPPAPAGGQEQRCHHGSPREAGKTPCGDSLGHETLSEKSQLAPLPHEVRPRSAIRASIDPRHARGWNPPPS